MRVYTAVVGTDKYAEGEKAGIWLEEHLEKEKERASNTPEDNDGISENIIEEREMEDGDELLDEIINIVILEGTPNSTAQIGRSKGFEDIAARNENWRILAQENGDFTKARARKLWQNTCRNLMILMCWYPIMMI